MQDTLTHETNLEKLIRIRATLYKELMRDLDIINYRKKTLLETFNKTITQIDYDILQEKKKTRYANILKKQKYDE